jgi:hypothetical protein
VFLVDWLRFTTLVDAGRASVLPRGWPLRLENIDVPRIPQYQNAEGADGIWHHWTPGGETQGALWTLTGQQLTKLREREYAVEDLLMHIHTPEIGGRVARIDIAMDVISADPIAVLDCKRALLHNRNATPARSMNYITGEALRSGRSTGDTLYLGARSSERFMRIYDKRAEMRSKNRDTSWLEGRNYIRVELEVKGRRAHELGRKLSWQTNSLESIIRAELAAFFSPPVGWYAQAIAGDMAAPVKVPRKVTNREHWLRTVCFPAMVDACADDRELLSEFLTQVMEAGR